MHTLVTLLSMSAIQTAATVSILAHEVVCSHRTNSSSLIFSTIASAAKATLAQVRFRAPDLLLRRKTETWSMTEMGQKV